MSRIKTAALSALLLSTALISGAGWRAQDTTARKKDSPPASAGQVRIPNRPSAALFKGQQGKQKTEIHFDPESGLVTLKLLVQDPNGFFIPNIRRENLV